MQQTEIAKLLDLIIQHQEGGWKVTRNADDPDGGFTVGGMTAKNFNKYSGLDACTYDTICDLLRRNPEQIKERVIRCYWKLFIEPLRLLEFPLELAGPVLSCAINLGTDDAVKILQRIIGVKIDGVFGPKSLAALLTFLDNDSRTVARVVSVKELFLREWMRVYINLVQENAQAWREYALHHTDKIPMVLRATHLEGWFNRVEFWR